MANPLKMLKLKPSGFQLIQEIPIAAPPKKVWASLLNINKWFGADPERSKQKLEAWPGGRWIAEDEGVASLHGIVTHIEPHKLLRFSGPLGMSHLPVNNVFIFELQPRDDGKTTLLRLGHRVYGFIDSEAKKRYSGGWKQMLPKLKELAEKR